MKKGSASLFGTTLVITAAIVAGVYLLDRAQRPAPSESTEDSGWTTLFSSPSSQNTSPSASSLNTPSSPSISPSPRHPGLDPGSSSSEGTTNTGHVSAETSSTGIDNIITCQHPEYGTVYSNAASCDEVDYDSRLSRADSFQAVPERDRYSATDYHSPESAAANSRSNSTMQKQQKPNLRLHGKSPPSGLNVSCKNSVGKALEIERTLAASDDPRESTWRDSYCKQRCEAYTEQCPVEDSYYYYDYRTLCRDYPCNRYQ